MERDGILTDSGEYAAESAWSAIRKVYPTIPWSNVIWFAHYVPRWSIIHWLSFHGGLSTRDMLVSWGT